MSSILIDEDGFLSIERKGKMKLQKCPHDTKNNCGDWCPLLNLQGTYLHFCNGEYAENIEDRRK